MSFFTSRKQNEAEAEREEKQVVKAPAAQHPIGFDTVLGANSTMEGALRSEGNVRLDGEFSGTLDIKGNVLVGETAKITADIEARNISIAGAVRGNVSGNKVQLLRTGRIWGDITASALTTEEGAFIDGKITMKGHSANRSEPLADIPTDSEPVEVEASVEATEMLSLKHEDDETEDSHHKTIAYRDESEDADTDEEDSKSEE